MKSSQIVKAHVVSLGNDQVYQALPSDGVDQHSPFLLLHHFGPKAMSPHVPALYVPPHPHRGFQPVTLVFQGSVRHRDSLGNDSIVSAGGVQWIKAGKGIVHSEAADPKMVEAGGEMEIIQLWINTPASMKMEPAQYLPRSEEEIPVIEKDGNGSVQILAGKIGDVTGSIIPQTPLNVWIWRGGRGDKFSAEVDTDWNKMIYVVKGSVSIGTDLLSKNQAYYFEDQAGMIDFTGEKEDTIAVLLSGKPIEEPMTQYGPFVMNTQTEIMEAMRDYQMGKMGILIDEN